MVAGVRDDQNSPYLSVVIPAYNEERRISSTLARLHGYLAQQPYGSEILVVSNGSRDRTVEVVQECARTVPNISVVSIPQKGKGVASKTGVLRSRGEIIFLCDADLSMPAEGLDRILRATETADIAAGSREAPGARRFQEPWYRHLMGRIFNRLVQLLAVPGVEDTQAGFKAFRRPVALKLFERQAVNGFGFDVELLYLARKYGYVTREVPIDWYFDADTRVRPGIDTLSMLGELIQIRVRDLLGRYGESAPAAARGGKVAR